MSMTNVTVRSSSNTPQSTSDQQPTLYQIRDSGVSIYTGYICKSESIKKLKQLLEVED